MVETRDSVTPRHEPSRAHWPPFSGLLSKVDNYGGSQSADKQPVICTLGWEEDAKKVIELKSRNPETQKLLCSFIRILDLTFGHRNEDD